MSDEIEARALTLTPALPSSLRDVASGHGLVVYTDQPGVQLYTGNFLDGSYVGKDGVPIEKHAGVCLETQAWPNAINNPVRNIETVVTLATSSDVLNNLHTHSMLVALVPYIHCIVIIHSISHCC